MIDSLILRCTRFYRPVRRLETTVTAAFDSATTICLQGATLRWFEDAFRLFFHCISWKSAIFLFSVCLTYWPRKYTACYVPTMTISAKLEAGRTLHGVEATIVGSG